MLDPNIPQPPPLPDPSGVVIYPLVMADIYNRSQMGLGKYGKYLTSGDGRCGLLDAYQEALDLAIYLRKEVYLNYGS